MGVIVDYFAGGGGASTGVEMAYGRRIDLAVNHDPEAVAMHAANHPETEHACADVFAFDLIAWLGSRTWDAWWASPDCTHHSRAKGGKPVSNKRRALADVVVDTVEALPDWQRPRVIHLENVPEFREWGPLGEDGRPDKARKGEFFAAWCDRLRACGYAIDHWDEVCADVGVPTTRKRLVLVARCDGLPIVRPVHTHYNPKAKGPKRVRPRGMKPWRTAASDVIDFSIPGKSIFGRQKPLADATLARVGRGLDRFVLKNPKPFLVPLTHHGKRRLHEMDEPLPTITCAHRGELAIVEPFLAGCGGRAAQSLEKSAAEPVNTLTTKADQIVVESHIVSVAHGDSGGRREYGLDEPLGTVHASGQSRALVSAHVTKFRPGSTGHEADEPLHTVTANSFEVRPGGAAPFGLVEAHMAPFIAGITQKSTPRVFDPQAPMPTITTAKGGELLAVAPMLVQSGYGERDGQAPRALDLDKPLGTVVSDGNKFAVAAAHMLRLQGNDRRDRAIDEPLGAVCAGGGHHAEVAAFLAQFNNTRGVDPQAGKAADVPLSTVSTRGPHQAVVEVDLTPDEIEAGCERVLAFMLKYYGTHQRGVGVDDPIDSVTTKDRFALITVHIEGVPYRIFDIRIRMLTARELFNAQGFPQSYIIDPMVPLSAKALAREVKRGSGITHKRMSKGSSIAKCGNSVPPGLAYAVAKANAPPMSRLEGRNRWAA